MTSIPLVDLGGIWHITIFIGIALTITKYLFKWTEDLLPLPAKLLWIYVLISALFILEWPVVHFGPYTHDYQATAGQAFVEMFFIPFGAIIYYYRFGKMLPFLILFSLVCVWCNYPGLLNAPSFNSAFAVLALPFLNPFLIALTVLTVCTHHGSTAILMLFVQNLIYLILYKKHKSISNYWWVPLLIGIAYFHSGHLFDGAERIQKYKEFFSFWAKESRWVLLGVGSGSFMWTSIIMDDFNPHQLFLQMHSDWLQILWEYGVVGFGLAVWTFIYAVRSAWDNPKILSAVFGCGVFALTYHPLRFYPTAFLTAYIFLQAFSCRSDSLRARP